MPASLDPLLAAVQQSSRFLLPVGAVNLVAGLALAVLDSSSIWRFVGVVCAAAGVVALGIWARSHNPTHHPVIRAIQEHPEQVRWIRVERRESPIGKPDRAVLHVGLAEGAHHAFPVEQPELAEAAATAIVERCPGVSRLEG